MLRLNTKGKVVDCAQDDLDHSVMLVGYGTTDDGQECTYRHVLYVCCPGQAILCSRVLALIDSQDEDSRCTVEVCNSCTGVAAFLMQTCVTSVCSMLLMTEDCTEVRSQIIVLHEFIFRMCHSAMITRSPGRDWG